MACWLAASWADSLCGWTMWNRDTRLTASWKLETHEHILSSNGGWSINKDKYFFLNISYKNSLLSLSYSHTHARKLTALSAACRLATCPPCERSPGTKPFLQSVWWSAAARICRACSGPRTWLRVPKHTSHRVDMILYSLHVGYTQHKTLHMKFLNLQSTFCQSYTPYHVTQRKYRNWLCQFHGLTGYT